MRLDIYDRPIFSDSDILEILYSGDADSLDKIIAENSESIIKFKQNSNLDIQINQDSDQSVEDFDYSNQKNWFMSDEYKNFDIEGFLVYKCPKENYQRLIDELVEFRNRNMIDLLRWLKFFVDTCRQNKIVWGVGRGSSVSSYVLYLIGVHKIDSIKYKLDYKEFLR